MDPLSQVLSLLKLRSYTAGGFGVDGDMALQFPQHEGIKCYAVISGQFRLSVEGLSEVVLLTAGDCFLLPRGLPFCLATGLPVAPIDFHTFLSGLRNGEKLAAPNGDGTGCYLAGSHFLLAGAHTDILLGSLPPVVHIQKESDKATMRWSLDRMREELREPQPGGSFVAQQLACIMLVQALRLHLADGAKGSVGWLFALADKQMSAAMACMHDDPGHPWTLGSLAGRVGMSRSVFAARFKATVGQTPMDYLTRWRMLLAGERLKEGGDSVSEIAYSLGYRSESAFGKAFKRVLGCSPKQGRRLSITQERVGEVPSTPASIQ